ncbi:MAG: hypothetical protein IPF46_15005 [Saprospiraceae bacterium]|nr:hypothetical protein [Candidatus Vicinibacter affinis]
MTKNITSSINPKKNDIPSHNSHKSQFRQNSYLTTVTSPCQEITEPSCRVN